MVSRLHESNRLVPSCCRSIQDCLHQPAADGAILQGRFDGDRTDAGYVLPRPEEIAAGNMAVQLGDDAVDIWPRHELADQAGRHVLARKVGRKTVLFGDRLESLIANPARRVGVSGSGCAELEGHGAILDPGSRPHFIDWYLRNK